MSTGGYALRAYERFSRLKPTGDGRLRIAHPRIAQQYRLNAGTIVEAPMIKVRLVGQAGAPSRPGASGASMAVGGGRVLGEVEEYFVEQLAPGMTFVFAGEILRFEGLIETEAFVSRAPASDAMIPSYDGGKFPAVDAPSAPRPRHAGRSTQAWRTSAGSCRGVAGLPGRSLRSSPRSDEVLIETFPRGGRHYLVVYPFEGRLAHQTLGMLLTRRLERVGARPMGFVANDYGLVRMGTRGPLRSSSPTARSLDLQSLFAEDMLGDDLEAWLAESNLMKRTFRNAAVIAGLIERRHPNREKSGRQVTMSTDLIYDVLLKHDPGHILLEAAWEDAATGLLDIARLGAIPRPHPGSNQASTSAGRLAAVGADPA